ncbi:MAG: AlpA family transcriptional regulator [Caulobacteraceae bacterium]
MPTAIAATADRPIRFLRLPEVMARTGLPRSTIYDGVRDGHFPRPVRIGARNVAWNEADVERWASALIDDGRTSHGTSRRQE